MITTAASVIEAYALEAGEGSGSAPRRPVIGLAAALDLLDGLILIGGGDVNPADFPLLQANCHTDYHPDQ